MTEVAAPGSTAPRWRLWCGGCAALGVLAAGAAIYASLEVKVFAPSRAAEAVLDGLATQGVGVRAQEIGRPEQPLAAFSDDDLPEVLAYRRLIGQSGIYLLGSELLKLALEDPQHPRVVALRAERSERKRKKKGGWWHPVFEDARGPFEEALAAWSGLEGPLAQALANGDLTRRDLLTPFGLRRANQTLRVETVTVLGTRLGLAAGENDADRAWAEAERLLRFVEDLEVESCEAWKARCSSVERAVHRVIGLTRAAVDPDPVRAERIQAALLRLEGQEALTRALRWDLHSLIQAIEVGGQPKLSSTESERGLQKAAFFLSGFGGATDRHQVFETYARAIQASTLPPREAQKGFHALSGVVAKQPKLTTRAITERLPRSFLQHLRAQSFLRLGRLALSLTRRDAFPEALEGLGDPCAGFPGGEQPPLRYRRVSPGVAVVWSVGGNGRDDAGVAPRFATDGPRKRRTLDIAFELSLPR